MDNFIVCGFATENTPYVDIAKENLISSCKNVGVELDFSIVPNLHSWKANTSYKATFAKEMLNKHSKNIVLLDADSKILQYPSLFSTIPEDFHIAAHYLDHNTWYRNKTGKKEFLSGSLFLRNSDITKIIVHDWEFNCKNSTEWEQKVLDAVIKHHGIRVFELPLEYCYINEVRTGQAPYVKCDNPVIVHYQASRQHKRFIN